MISLLLLDNRVVEYLLILVRLEEGWLVWGILLLLQDRGILVQMGGVIVDWRGERTGIGGLRMIIGLVGMGV